MISSSRSLLREPSRVLTAADWVSTLAESVTSLSASSIRPRPIKIRPTRPTVVDCRAMNSTTPIKMKRGESQDRSRENSRAIRLVPMSAPSITASAPGRLISPCPKNEDTISAVAVLDCSSAVTPIPDKAAVNRLATLRASTWRRFAPNTRKMPVRTSWVPQTSRAIAASRLSKWVKQFPSGLGAQRERRTRKISSRIRQPAPKVMALSAMLKAGKCPPVNKGLSHDQ